MRRDRRQLWHYYAVAAAGQLRGQLNPFLEVICVRVAVTVREQHHGVTPATAEDGSGFHRTIEAGKVDAQRDRRALGDAVGPGSVEYRGQRVRLPTDRTGRWRRYRLRHG